MDVRIFVETVFEDGEVLTNDVGQICRRLRMLNRKPWFAPC